MIMGFFAVASSRRCGVERRLVDGGLGQGGLRGLDYDGRARGHRVPAHLDGGRTRSAAGGRAKRLIDEP
jgi:hypothetical protein